MKRTVEVAVMGQKFMVRSDSQEDYVSEIADYVNEKVAEITSKTKSIPSLNVAILAAMNIADEFMKMRRDKSAVSEKLQKKVSGMIELIDLQM